MNAIGGYFELADRGVGVFPHQDGILLNTGRNALEYILRSIGEIKGVYLPYYTCEVVLEPLKKLQIPWRFYHINSRLELADEIRLEAGEYLITNNYFGIKDAYIRKLAEKYSDHLIVDCAQAFFADPIPGIKSFYSARKYVGVADGGIAYLDGGSRLPVPVEGEECTSEHDSHLYIRKQSGPEAGFKAYQENEKKLDGQPIRRMSDKTMEILDCIDYDAVVARRRENFLYLHRVLADRNQLMIPEMESFSCPMAYPLLTDDGNRLRGTLIENACFIAKYWPGIRPRTGFEMESDLTDNLLALPCDQRYGTDEMIRMVKVLNHNLN